VTALEALQAVTQAAFGALFLLTIVDFARRRDRIRLEIALLFGSIGVPVLIQAYTTATGTEIPYWTAASGVFLLGQPYILVRLLSQFRRVPRVQHIIALACFIVSSCMIVIGQGKPDATQTIVLVLAFGYVEAYASFGFVRTALVTRGVTHKRLVAAGAGSGFLALIFLLAPIATIAPASAVPMQVISQVFAIASALAYYIGFATPGWLRMTWQFAELKNFLVGLAGRTGEERLTSLLDNLAPAAARAVGAKAVVVMLAPEGEQHLMIRSAGNSRQTFGTTHAVIVPDGLLTQARNEGEAIAADISLPWGDRLTELATSFGGARSVIVCPLSAHGGYYGLVAAFFEGRSLFLRDEVELLKSLSEQAAFSLEGSQLYADAKQAASKRLALHSLSQAIAAESEISLIGQRLMEHISQLLPGSAWDLSLFTSEGELEIVAAKDGGESTGAVRRLAQRRGSSSTALRSDGALIVDDPAADPDFASILPGTQSLLVAPLKRKNAVIGALRCFSLTPGVFTQTDVQLAEIVATDVAVGVARAELLEHLTRQNLELENASRLKSEFLANMSHELRTPLNAILGFSELLQDGGETAATRLIYLRTIHESGAHLLALINDILDLAKVEAGQMDLHLEEVDAPDIVGGVVATLQPLAERKHIIVEAFSEAGIRLTADAGKVKQILYNLLSNAIKFTPEAGLVRVQASAAGEAVRFSVTDTGIGIAEEDQERVFHEFQQVDGAASRQYEGTGLGLALTRRFAELHGGRIWLESTLGQGSTFHVEIPAQPLMREQSVSTNGMWAPPDAVSMNGAAPLVLVVENDAQSANLLCAYLTRGGYRSQIAADGLEVMEKARSLKPVAITLDILLPHVDGWELLRSLKADETTRDIPVVIVSVVDDEQLGYALGAADYFVKPVERQALLARLAAHTLTAQLKDREVRVLVVDDDPAAVELISGMLAPIGFTVLRASGGTEGIALAKAQLPEVILLDLMMPDVSGFDVVSALKSEARTRDIPILIVTAKDMTAAEKNQLNGQVTAILAKGSSVRIELLTWLRQIPQPSQHLKAA
jgi:signal transduction histidine kinase/DNA-binding response OmpR family regulator